MDWLEANWLPLSIVLGGYGWAWAVWAELRRQGRKVRALVALFGAHRHKPDGGIGYDDSALRFLDSEGKLPRPPSA